jgi:hypothetical protein
VAVSKNLRLTLLAALSALLLVPAAAPAAEIGLNMNGGAAAATADNWSMLGDTNTKWARHFVVYTGGTAVDSGYDAIVREEEARGIKTLFVVTALGGVKPNADDYASFVGNLAKRYKGQVEAYEVWNEADEPGFWPGAPQPGEYVNLLQKAYSTIKAADPSAKVVFSPTTGNNYEFLEGAYRAGAKGFFDVMAVHTDTACLVDSPTKYYRDGGRLARFTFLGYREVRATMLANGDDKPIWMTEFGWSTTKRTCDRGVWAGQKPAGVSEADQATFLREAYHCLKEDPYVEVAMWFNSRDVIGDGSELDSYGLRRLDGTQKPAYQAFKDVVAGRDTVIGGCGDFGGPAVNILSPQNGHVFGADDSLLIKATSPDDDVMRMTFAVQGQSDEIRNFTNSGNPLTGPSLIDWQGAKRLGFGKHTVVVTAVDRSGNVGRSSVEVAKVNPSNMSAQSTRLQIRLRGKGRVRKVSGRVLSQLRFAIPGKVKVQWQNRRGGRWKKIHGGAKNANKPFTFTQRLRYSGKWRVRVTYTGKHPFRRSASAWKTFTVR